MNYRNSALALCFVILGSSGIPALADSKASDALINQASQLLQQGDITQAADMLTKGIYGDPANMKLRRLLAQTHLQAGNNAAAAAIMQQVVKVDRSADSLCCMGNCCFALGQMKDARTNYTNALKATPDHVQSIVGLINLAISDSDYQSARALCAQGLTRVKDKAGQTQLRQKMAEIDQQMQTTSTGPKADS